MEEQGTHHPRVAVQVRSSPLNRLAPKRSVRGNSMIICDQHIRLTRGRKTIKAEYLIKDPAPGVGVRAACADHLLEEVQEVKKRHAPGTVDVVVTVLPSR